MHSNKSQIHISIKFLFQFQYGSEHFTESFSFLFHNILFLHARVCNISGMNFSLFIELRMKNGFFEGNFLFYLIIF